MSETAGVLKEFHNVDRVLVCHLNLGVKDCLRFVVLQGEESFTILLDSGANHSVISNALVQKYSLQMIALPKKIPLFIFSTSSAPSQWISHFNKWTVRLPFFPTFEWEFLIVDSPNSEDLILGDDFLFQWNPVIDWKEGLITPRTNQDTEHHSPAELTKTVTSYNMSFTEASPSQPSEQLELEQTIHFHPSSVIERTFKDNPEAEDSSEGYSFNLLINKLLIQPSEPPQPSHGPDPWEDWDEDEEEEDIETILSVVPSVYHDFLEVFSKAKASKLPERRPCNHSIELVGSLPPVRPIYSLSNKEYEVLRAYINDNLSKDFICSSTSSTGAGVIFAPNKDGGLRLCVDYRKLNSVTHKNRYPVPPMCHLLTLFNGATIFTKIDLRDGYYLICILYVNKSTHLSASTLGQIPLRL